MADHADVRSLEQIELFLQKTETYRAQMMKQLDNLGLELRRLSTWIKTDAHGYWSDELNKARRKLTACQDALVRCMSCVREDERRPCSEEKKRLRRAEERRSLCEQMLKTVDAAADHWEREQAKNQARLQSCRDMAESNLLVACNQLRDQIEQLRLYSGLRSPAVSKPQAGSPAARPVSGVAEDKADGFSEEAHETH